MELLLEILKDKLVIDHISHTTPIRKGIESSLTPRKESLEISGQFQDCRFSIKLEYPTKGYNISPAPITDNLNIILPKGGTGATPSPYYGILHGVSKL